MSLRGVTVGSATPINGQILQYNGTVWAPASFVPALAGDLSGNTGAAVVARIQGRGVVNTAPGSGQVLKWNGSQWAPADDIGANGSDATSIRGIAVSTTAPTSSQILQYNGSQWAPAVLVTDHSVGADLFGTLSTAKVVKIQGRAVVSTAPTGGQVLTWNGVTFQWEPQTLPATNASKLQGVAISSTAPTSGQFLQYSGTTWAPVSVSMGDATTIQGKVVSATAPQPGQLLQFDGSQYVPTSFAPTANAKELQNVLIATTTPTLNQALVYNGTEWGPKDDVRQISYAIEDTTNDLTATTGSVATVFSNRLTSAMKIVEVYCQTNVAAASTFNLAIGGTNLFSTAQNCTSTGNAYPTGFVVSSIGAGVNVSHNMVTAAAGTKRMSITLLYKF